MDKRALRRQTHQPSAKMQELCRQPVGWNEQAHRPQSWDGCIRCHSMPCGSSSAKFGAKLDHSAKVQAK